MRNKQCIYGIAATVLFHLLILLALFRGALTYPPEDVTVWPPEPEEMIVAQELEPLYQAGELVRLGDNLETPTADDTPAVSSETIDEPTQPGIDAANNGHAGKPNPQLTQKHESPTKVKEEQKGPTKAELEAEKKRQEAKKQEQARKTADDAARRAFSRDKNANGSGQSGKPDGKAGRGSFTGTPGNGPGRSVERWGSVSSTLPGTIAIRVTVDSEGNVTSARYTSSGSTGAVAADRSMRQRCEQASRGCRFSRIKGSKPTTGTIYWKFQ